MTTYYFDYTTKGQSETGKVGFSQNCHDDLDALRTLLMFESEDLGFYRLVYNHKYVLWDLEEAPAAHLAEYIRKRRK